MNKDTNDTILQNILKNSRPYEEGLYEDLQDPEEAQAYLEASLEAYEEDGDTAALLLALYTFAKCKVGLINCLRKQELTAKPSQRY